MRTIAVVNNKGGVAKTTTVVNMAYLLATAYQKRVLVVDADGQRNATWNLLGAGQYDGLMALIEGTASCYDEVVEPTDIENLDVIPASSSLWEVDLSFAQGIATKHIFHVLADVRDCIIEDDEYDVMLIDCPPYFSGACIAAIMAADSVIVPVTPDAYAAEGMADLVKQIHGMRSLNPELRVSGCLITQWHNADVVTKAADYIRENSPVYVYEHTIRRTDKVIESTWARESVLAWSPQSAAARDYRAWMEEFLDREGMR